MTPDDLAVFRCARLLLLLGLAEHDLPEGLDAERLGIFDFLAGYPLLLARDAGDPDRTALRLAGFDDRAIGYGGAGPLLATRQQQLGRDLSALVSAGLAETVADGRIRYRLTGDGREAVVGISAAYARSYTTAAAVVLRRLRRLSGRRLRETVRRCLDPVPRSKDAP
ncbi:hypothetical protein [Paractinoplanes lichenicola]|uniref:HTH marR-type domain-containing protein n=1 Tax=Paractinoplanes lichenicola TaxID=2802976 RepID=A0ABS1VZC0_9ACTN|nr:hypothetical protein [Actinoplanes lichenicola]MBL7259836.1 hypothetical protein [Actinoplanes lichenicola]